MSLTDRVRAVIHNMEDKFSVQEIIEAEPSIDTNEASGILARLYVNGEIDHCEMVRRGRTRTRYYMKTEKLRPAKNTQAPISRKMHGFMNPPPVKIGRGILGVRVHRLGD